ncbi:MAG: RnfH family protein [Nevskiales bacterium]
MTRPALIEVEVAYALPELQLILALQLPRGATVQQAIEKSGIHARFPGIDLKRAAIGVFGRAVLPTLTLQDGDRVEIYRPLIADPKQQRRQRVANTRSESKNG